MKLPNLVDIETASKYGSTTTSVITYSAETNHFNFTLEAPVGSRYTNYTMSIRIKLDSDPNYPIYDFSTVIYVTKCKVFSLSPPVLKNITYNLGGGY